METRTPILGPVLILAMGLVPVILILLEIRQLLAGLAGAVAGAGG